MIVGFNKISLAEFSNSYGVFIAPCHQIELTSLQRDIISGIRTPPIIAFIKKHLCYELEEFSLFE